MTRCFPINQYPSWLEIKNDPGIAAFRLDTKGSWIYPSLISANNFALAEIESTVGVMIAGSGIAAIREGQILNRRVLFSVEKIEAILPSIMEYRQGKVFSINGQMRYVHGFQKEFWKVCLLHNSLHS